MENPYRIRELIVAASVISAIDFCRNSLHDEINVS